MMWLMRYLNVLILLLLSLMCSSSQASTQFLVGGKRGIWAVKPSRHYDHWSQINRFQVNDTLVFRYTKGHDSVLLVNEEDYVSCNKTEPISRLENQGYYTKFKFEHSGPFFFISGRTHHCEKGQKIRIVVMAPRPIPAPSPSPVTAVSPTPSEAPAPSAYSLSPAPSPGGDTGGAVAAFGDGGSVKLLFCVLSTSFVLGNFNWLGWY